MIKKLLPLGSPRGITLVETLVAVGILAFIGVGFLSALSSSSSSTDLYKTRVTAASLAQSQLEELKTLPYLVNYDTYVISSPPGYAIDIGVVETQVGKQEVTVSVSRGGDFVLKISTIKTNW